MASMPSITSMPAAESRKLRLEGKSAFPVPEKLDVGADRTIPGRSGEIGLRVFTPPVVEGVVLHIHGGGWTFGANWMQDALLWEIAQSASVAVCSVEYRLAPEDPFPAGNDDCEDAACWLANNSLDEFGTTRLFIAGESAGAHLAASTLLRLRDREDCNGAFSGAVLTFGCYDLSLTPSVRRWGERQLILNTPIVEWFADQYLPGMGAEERRDPSVSPLYADLSLLCPALFLVGTADPLLDDTLFMERRWRAAGNATELHVYEDAAHGFIAFPITYAEEAKQAISEFARSMGA
jgi:acetyl esterase/lipase